MIDSEFLPQKPYWTLFIVVRDMYQSLYIDIKLSFRRIYEYTEHDLVISRIKYRMCSVLFLLLLLLLYFLYPGQLRVKT